MREQQSALHIRISWDMSEIFKKKAAEAALLELRPGMRLGLGTGSTAKHFVALLGEKVAQGFECICVPTSEETAAQARALSIPLSDLETLTELDLTIDGADEIDADLNLIKGGGGALLREKIVADASVRMIVIADGSKLVESLGRFPLPIEVNAFGFGATMKRLEKITKEHGAEGGLKQRMAGDKPFVTDGGHLIIDAFFGRISDAKALSNALLDIPGVVQHGLFLNICAAAYVVDANGLKKLGK
jgi:ribose 5-phosphate isomerase A